MKNLGPHSGVVQRSSLWLGAPVMVLATCVGAAPATGGDETAARVADWTWPVAGKAAASPARKDLARQATYVIHAADRARCPLGAQAAWPEQAFSVAPAPPELPAPLAARLDVARSTHQSSAP